MKATDEPTPTERLLNALHKLTQPQKVANWQKGHEHDWQKCKCKDDECTALICEWCDATFGEAADAVPHKGEIKRRVDLPLLDWLHDAIASDTGGGGGGKAPRERTPMDVGAFTLYEDIDGRVRSWMFELGATPGKDLTPTQILASWYVLWNVRNPGDGLVSAFAGILEGWVQAIEDTMDPPGRFEITSPCPSCGQEWINVGLKLGNGQDDPDDVERVRVLVAVERENIHESYAMCRACERVWRGAGQCRQLRIAIDDAEAV